MISNIIKIEQDSISVILNLNDVNFITLEKDRTAIYLKIFLTQNPASPIIISENRKDKKDDLEDLFLDLYTKWKNNEDELANELRENSVVQYFEG